MAILASANHPRTECEKTLINNSFESILDEDVPYSIVVKNVTSEETRNMFKAFAMHFFVFFIYYIFNLQYPEKLETTFFLLLIRKLTSKCEESAIRSINKADVRFERKERTCLKVLLQYSWLFSATSIAPVNFHRKNSHVLLW